MIYYNNKEITENELFDLMKQENVFIEYKNGNKYVRDLTIEEKQKQIENINRLQNQSQINELKLWFNNYYTTQEQKLRRLITLNKLCDDNSKPQDKILALYNEAEVKRKQIQESENK